MLEAPGLQKQAAFLQVGCADWPEDALFHWEDRSKLNEAATCPVQSIKRALLGAGQRRREKAET